MVSRDDGIQRWDHRRQISWTVPLPRHKLHRTELQLAEKYFNSVRAREAPKNKCSLLASAY